MYNRFSFDFPIIYDLGSKIKLFIATLQSYGLQTFTFYRAIYFKKRNNSLNTQQAQNVGKKYWYTKLCRENSFIVHYKRKNSKTKKRIKVLMQFLNTGYKRFDLNFCEFFFKYVHAKDIFIPAEDHRCINFSKSFRIL